MSEGPYLWLKRSKRLEPPFVQTMGTRRTSLGEATYIRIYTSNYRQLSWTEVWECFSRSFPGRWAVQAFPPEEDLVDEVNMYHLFVLECEPYGFNIKRR